MSRGLKLCLAGLLLTFTVAWFGRESCFSAFGRYLTDAHRGLSVADVVVVPAADSIRADLSIETLEEAAKLVRDGRVKHIVMSCAEVYGVSECELAEKWLRDRGYPGTQIDWLRTERLADEMEADKAMRYLRERGVKSAIVLLPSYKARRLGGAYRRLGAKSAIQVDVWGQNREFDPQTWWRSRGGQKRFSEEFLRLARLL
jgi:hypothetical protein